MADPLLPHPPGWKVITLAPGRDDYIARVETGGTPSTRDEAYWDGDVPWLTPKEVTRSGGQLYVSSTERMITAAGLAKAGGVLPTNTVLLTKRAPVGAVAVNAVPMATNQGFLSFVCGARLRPLYLAYWLRVNKPYLDKVANGSTYPELYVGDLFEFEMAVPDLAGQDAILAVVRALSYLLSLGASMEHTVATPAELVRLQGEDRALGELLERVLPALFAGQLNARRALDERLERVETSAREVWS